MVTQQLPDADQLLAMIHQRVEQTKRGLFPQQGEMPNSKLLELALAVFSRRVAIAADQYQALWVLTYLAGGAVTLPADVMKKYPGHDQAQLQLQQADNGKDYVLRIPGMERKLDS